MLREALGRWWMAWPLCTRHLDEGRESAWRVVEQRRRWRIAACKDFTAKRWERGVLSGNEGGIRYNCTRAVQHLLRQEC